MIVGGIAPVLVSFVSGYLAMAHETGEIALNDKVDVLVVCVYLIMSWPGWIVPGHGVYTMLFEAVCWFCIGSVIGGRIHRFVVSRRATRHGDQ
jgi:hypothetical protein